VIEKNKITWRSFVDVGQAGAGPIATKWNLPATPTFYVIDAQGVIRYKWAGAPGAKVMDAALDELIDAAAIKTVLVKAINAAGGLDEVAKLKNVTWKGKGNIDWDENQLIFKVDISAQGWDRLRLEMEIQWQREKNAIDFTVVMNGSRAWIERQNVPEPAANELALRDLYFALRAPQMLQALLAKEFRLKHLGEVRVKGQPAVGLRISRKGRPDIALFFDKKTGLPVKAELLVTNPAFASRVFFSDYKEFDGLTHFTKITFANPDKEKAKNQLIRLMELSDIRPRKQLEPSLFERPQERQRVYVIVRLPSSDALVWFDDHRTKQTGAERLFESPPLREGKYTYSVRAKWRQDGKDMNQTRTVGVQPGQWLTVDFNPPKAR
jgi:uncharacterized protein (TIGR03000 family)